MVKMEDSVLMAAWRAKPPHKHRRLLCGSSQWNVSLGEQPPEITVSHIMTFIPIRRSITEVEDQCNKYFKS